MIIGIGIDLIEVKRMEEWLINSRLLERYFHPHEIEYSKKNKNTAALSLAARFAAKEAFGKALGTGFAGLSLKDILIENRKTGQPELKVFGTALKAYKNSGADKIHISLSHEKENAVAMVVLEG